MFYLYVLYSPSASKFYVGHSQNPIEALAFHNSDTESRYTGKYSDWEIRSVFEVSDSLEEALELKRFINKQKTRKLVLKLTDPKFEPSGALEKLKRTTLS